MKEFIKEQKNSYSFCKITFKLLCTKGEKISNIFPRLFSEKLSRISGKKRKKKPTRCAMQLKSLVPWG